MPKDFAIVIPHYQDQVRLTRCLDALAAQMDSLEQVIVVDNASPQRPEVREGVRLVIEPKKGAAEARNRGVAETTAHHIFFLDCDCVPDPDWVKTAQEVVGRADVIGGTISVFDETTPPRSGAEAFETVFAFDNKGYIERKGFSVTANLLTTRPVLDSVGGFRAGMSEDLDWCLRAGAAGFRLAHEDRLRVAHPTRSDWAALRRKWLRLTQEAWGLAQETPMARVKWAGRALAMPLSALAHVPKVLRHPGLAGWRERFAGLGTLFRLRIMRMAWMLRQAAGLG